MINWEAWGNLAEAASIPFMIGLCVTLGYMAWAYRKSWLEVEDQITIAESQATIERRRANGLLTERDHLRRIYHETALERDQLQTIQREFMREMAITSLEDIKPIQAADLPPITLGPTLPIYPN